MAERQIARILEGLCPGEDISSYDGLVDGRILDSLTLVALVAELEDVFDITIPAVEIVADNFNSVKAMGDMVERLISDQIGF